MGFYIRKNVVNRISGITERVALLKIKIGENRVLTIMPVRSY